MNKIQMQTCTSRSDQAYQGLEVVLKSKLWKVLSHTFSFEWKIHCLPVTKHKTLKLTPMQNRRQTRSGAVPTLNFFIRPP